MVHVYILAYHIYFRLNKRCDVYYIFCDLSAVSIRERRFYEGGIYLKSNFL